MFKYRMSKDVYILTLVYKDRARLSLAATRLKIDIIHKLLKIHKR